METNIGDSGLLQTHHIYNNKDLMTDVSIPTCELSRRVQSSTNFRNMYGMQGGQGQ